ncbi:MAG: hypothetical protein JST08_09595 [Actinobacteria bacterium]|nr:hypothetical protein [Actinomycetota bacterium]
MPEEPPGYYLVVQRALGDPERAKERIDEHMAWLKERLAERRLFLTGVAETEGGTGRDAGFLLVRAESFEDARAVAEDDPFLRHGIRSIELLRVIPMNGEIRADFWGGVGSLA